MLSEEQKRRIEENRQRALERRRQHLAKKATTTKQTSLLSFFSPPKSAPVHDTTVETTEQASPKHESTHDVAQLSRDLSKASLSQSSVEEKSSIEKEDMHASTSIENEEEEEDVPESLTSFPKLDESSISNQDESEEPIRTRRNLRRKKRVRYVESDEEEEALEPSKKSNAIMDSDDDDDDDDEYKLSDKDMDMDDMEVDVSQNKTSSKSEKSRLIEVTTNQTSKSLVHSSIEKLKAFASSSSTKRSEGFSSTSSLKSNTTSTINDRNRHPDRYPWLVDIRDADGHPVGHPDYNPRTLFIPKSAWSKFTPFEKQFWEIKSQFFDTVVFFKKGKFYELYENDADIGHQEFDLKMTDRVNMRMVGVPERSFNIWAGKFIAKGYKVAKVDQLETAIGKSMREKVNKDTDKLIRRELTSVLTGGTLVDAELLTNDMATYCLCIKEQVGSEIQARPLIGVVFVDTSCAEFNLCQFVDEPDRSRLETLLAQIQPKEVIYEKGHLSRETMRVLKNTLYGTIWNALVPGREFWDANTTAFELNGGGYFEGGAWPKVLLEAKEQPCMFSAMGGLLWYLRQLRLDKELVSLKNFHMYDPIRRASSLIIDGQTLKNLEIFENNFDGGSEGTLFNLLNKCVTPFGKRMFKRWVCHPLRSAKAINARLDTVDELNRDMDLQRNIRQSIMGLPDLERMLSRVHAGTCKLKDLFKLLDAFTAQSELMANLREACKEHGLMNVAALCARFPDLDPPLAYFRTAFDREIAEREGSVVPFPGVEKDFDEIEAKINHITQRLQDYLEEQRRELKCSRLVYRNVGKEIYQIEAPKHVKVPANFIRLSQTKEVNRYWSPTLRVLVREFEEAQETKNNVLNDIQRRVYVKFDEYYDLWIQAVKVIAELDCLLGLATCATTLGEPCCRPEFVEDGPPRLELEELRHPCVVPGIASDFIPNDTLLGGDQARMILLTGPNMGGKSTLLRQTCIAIIMAQLGCYVPARRCRMTVVDRIFTRIGANDNIMAGQSTFMVELSETSKILHEATPHSLVILDELGRGTSTFDGYAIAYAVLHYLATYVGCLGLFSTHYGLLTEEMASNPNIRLMHMACYVDEDRKEVTFLYKLTDGACPKSYGMHVANMAGVPTEIVSRAEHIAKTFEQQSRGHQLVMQHGKELRVTDQGDFAYLQSIITNTHPTHDTMEAVRRIWRTWKTRIS